MAVHLRPHKFQAVETPISWRPQYVDNSPPTIYVLGDVIDRMQAYVDLGDEEVGWMGTAHKVNDKAILVDQVFLIEQRVSGVETTLTRAGFGQFCKQLQAERPREFGEIMNALVFWGHSHVNMETNPSFKDEETVQMFQQNGREWFVRAILNKKGRMEITYFDFKTGRKIIDAPWVRVDEEKPDLRKQVEEEFKAKVHSMGFGSSFFRSRHGSSSNSNLGFDLAATLKQIRTPPPEEIYDTEEEPVEGLVKAEIVPPGNEALTKDGKPSTGSGNIPTAPVVTDVPAGWESAIRRREDAHANASGAYGDGAPPDAGRYPSPATARSNEPQRKGPAWAYNKPNPPEEPGKFARFMNGLWRFLTFRWR
jgi:hypothetical protein